MTKKKKPGKEKTGSEKPTELNDSFLKLYDLERSNRFGRKDSCR